MTDLLTVTDCIDRTRHREWKPLNFAAVNREVVHRLSFADYSEDNPRPIADEMLDGIEVRERFKDPALGTGGRVPYHVLVTHFGVDQMLPLFVRGSHASGVNWCSWAVAIVGNFDKRSITPDLWFRSVEVVACLATLLKGLPIVGHTEIPGAADDHQRTKNCVWWFYNDDGGRGRDVMNQEADGVWMLEGRGNGPSEIRFKGRVTRVDANTLRGI